MTETQQTITDWSREVFGPYARADTRHVPMASQLAHENRGAADRMLDFFGNLGGPALIAARMNQEVAELIEELVNSEEQAKVESELGDVGILLMQVAHSRGIDLMAAIDKKMAVNRRRKWKVGGIQGIGQHVEE